MFEQLLKLWRIWNHDSLTHFFAKTEWPTVATLGYMILNAPLNSLNMQYIEKEQPHESQNPVKTTKNTHLP